VILKILFLIIILVLIYLFFFKVSRGDKSPKKSNNPKLQGETMVECPACGTFVSNKEAIIKNGQFFCSRECAKI
jgi:uncharacterized protein